MKILILGSGVLGVTTAYELGRRGFSVTVIDRQPESARETSFANGGQLSYSHAEPWANPTVLPLIPKWLFRADAPLVFRPRADWQMIRWGVKFLRNCTGERARVNCVNLLRLGLYSQEKMAEIRRDTRIDFDFDARGIIHIYSTEEDFEHAKRQNEFQAKFGGDERVLTKEQCYELEPVLADSQRPVVGAIHAHGDETGDPYLFCRELARVAAERYGVQFHYGVTIHELKSERNMVTAAITDQGDISADGFVMALGSYSPLLLKPLSIDIPIYPMKGYSITLAAGAHCPAHSITDGTHKIVYSRLGDRLRIAGTAEFAGYDQGINDKRIASIVRAAKELLPNAGWEQDIQSWACLRPSTPDGPPVLGKTPFNNLFLNTGHGTLGWTQAAGSATIVADIMEGRNPGIIMQGLTTERYVA